MSLGARCSGHARPGPRMFMAAAGASSGRRNGRARASWGFADQVLSSATNFALTVVAAQMLTSRDFGVFAIVIAIYVLSNGTIRGLASEPLVVLFSDTSPSVQCRAAAVAVTRGAAGASVLTLAIVAVAELTHGLPRPTTFVLLALLLPGLVVQDTARFALMTLGRPRIAFESDVVWAVLQGVAVPLLIATNRASLSPLVTCWGVGATLAGAYALVRGGIVIPLDAVGEGIRTRARFGGRFAADFLISQSGTQLIVVLLGTLASAPEAGKYRVAQAAFGPLVVIMSGTRFAVIPELVRARHRPALLHRRVVQVTVALTAVAIAWGVFVYVMPASFGRSVFDAKWDTAHMLIPAVTVAIAAGAAETGALSGIRAVADASGGLRARVVVGALTLLAAGVGADFAGAQGAAIGAAAAGAPGFLVWWAQFRASISTASRAPAYEPHLARDSG